MSETRAQYEERIGQDPAIQCMRAKDGTKVRLVVETDRPKGRRELVGEMIGTPSPQGRNIRTADGTYWLKCWEVVRFEVVD